MGRALIDETLAHGYRIAAQNFYFHHALPEMESFEIKSEAPHKIPASFSPTEKKSPRPISHAEGWVANARRVVEIYATERWFLLKAEGGEYLIAAHGETIGKTNPQEELSQFDREIILGPALTFALALRGIWSLHASAAMYKENAIVFLGDSGMGKSTLAAYLSQNENWRLIADDILPIKMEANKINALPRFPQMKFPPNMQPGVNFAESLPLKTICVLKHAEANQAPELQKIPMAQTVQALLGHIAGTRMFSAELLAKHLAFSTQAAPQATAYELKYPHRKEALPQIKDFLEKIC